MRFSERIGKRPVKVDLQLDSMDADLRNGIWNIINIYILNPMRTQHSFYLPAGYDNLFFNIWFSHYREPIDDMKKDCDSNIFNLRSRYFTWDYLGVYDFINFLVEQSNTPFQMYAFIKDLNFILERELSGYRVVDKLLVPITNETEISEIESALNNTSIDKYRGAHIHLKEALNKMADRKSPDYRNSIKESISSIESACQVIANDPKAELGKALKLLKNKMPIHGALEQGFVKIYGYTSDSDGIRHALLEESKLEQEDAMFMLVSCSAFLNYLIAKANKIQS